MMLDGIKQYLYLVVDRETNRILTRCRNASTANAVSRGFLNSTVMVINRPDFFHNDRMKIYHKNSEITFILTIKNSSGVPSLESNVGEKTTIGNEYFNFIENTDTDQEWNNKRSLANTRSEIFSNIEAKIERYLARYSSFVGDSILYQHLSQEFDKCKIDEDYYSESIIEYSKILSMSPYEAFNDLKMKYDSISIITMRYSAIWEKNILAINSITDYSNKSQLYLDIEAELAGLNRQ
jgi:hypothetical protein